MKRRLSHVCALALGLGVPALAAIQPAQAAPAEGHTSAAVSQAGSPAPAPSTSPAAPSTPSGGAKPASAPATPVDTSACTAPTLTQPFLSSGDRHWYTLPAGETPDSFAGGGWTLLGGAKVKTAKLADGSTGSVLDLPTGAQAISPTICVTSQYPSARTMIKNVAGHGGVSLYMSLAGTRTWQSPQSSGRRHGKRGAWTLTNRINMHPPHVQGWHLMRIKLVSRGVASDVELYDFYVDPRMWW